METFNRCHRCGTLSLGGSPENMWKESQRSSGTVRVDTGDWGFESCDRPASTAREGSLIKHQNRNAAAPEGSSDSERKTRIIPGPHSVPVDARGAGLCHRTLKGSLVTVGTA